MTASSLSSWQRPGDNSSSLVAPSRTPGFDPGTGTNGSASGDGQAAPSTGTPTTARNRCLGQGSCPWCLLHCTADEHGDLLAAGRRVLEAKQQSLAIMGATCQQIAATTGKCWMMSLFACIQQMQQETRAPTQSASWPGCACRAWEFRLAWPPRAQASLPLLTLLQLPPVGAKNQTRTRKCRGATLWMRRGG